MQFPIAKTNPYTYIAFKQGDATDLFQEHKNKVKALFQRVKDKKRSPNGINTEVFQDYIEEYWCKEMLSIIKPSLYHLHNFKNNPKFEKLINYINPPKKEDENYTEKEISLSSIFTASKNIHKNVHKSIKIQVDPVEKTVKLLIGEDTFDITTAKILSQKQVNNLTNIENLANATERGEPFEIDDNNNYIPRVVTQGLDQFGIGKSMQLESANKTIRKFLNSLKKDITREKSITKIKNAYFKKEYITTLPEKERYFAFKDLETLQFNTLSCKEKIITEYKDLHNPSMVYLVQSIDKQKTKDLLKIQSILQNNNIDNVSIGQVCCYISKIPELKENIKLIQHFEKKYDTKIKDNNLLYELKSNPTKKESTLYNTMLHDFLLLNIKCNLVEKQVLKYFKGYNVEITEDNKKERYEFLHHHIKDFKYQNNVEEIKTIPQLFEDLLTWEKKLEADNLEKVGTGSTEPFYKPEDPITKIIEQLDKIDEFTVLKCEKDLVNEGTEQSHCVAGYANYCESHRSIIIKQTESIVTRSTIEVTPTKVRDTTDPTKTSIKLHISQNYGKKNLSVGVDTANRCQKIIDSINKENKVYTPITPKKESKPKNKRYIKRNKNEQSIIFVKYYTKINGVKKENIKFIDTDSKKSVSDQYKEILQKLAEKTKSSNPITVRIINGYTRQNIDDDYVTHTSSIKNIRVNKGVITQGKHTTSPYELTPDEEEILQSKRKIKKENEPDILWT